MRGAIQGEAQERMEVQEEVAKEVEDE